MTMSIDDGGRRPTDRFAYLRALARGLAQAPQDPITLLQAASAQDARRPTNGGLIGSGYAAYMAAHAPQSPGFPAASLFEADPGGVGPGGGQAPSNLVGPAPAAPQSAAGASSVDPRAAQLADLKDYLSDPEVEDSKPYVYQDSRNILTGGIGHKILPSDNLKDGDPVSAPLIQQWFEQDGGRALDAARAQAAEAGIADPAFVTPLASVNFQLGPAWRKRFPNAWRQILAGDYAGAADEVAKSSQPGRDSDWMRQTPTRVRAFQAALRALPPKPAGP
jgi:hypothetical protein